MNTIDPVWIPRTTRPPVMGTKHMVSAGHYLATAAGVRILEAGGNAFDAGVAAGLCLNVVQCDMTNLGGVAPICFYHAGSGKVQTISGVGWWPAAVDVQVFHDQHDGRIGGGIRDCVVPAAADAWLVALETYGTMALADVAAPAIELAEEGFPLHSVMADSFRNEEWRDMMVAWPSTRAVFVEPKGRFPAVGERVVQKDLGRTLRRLVEAEGGASSRAAGIRAARDRFYTGDIAEEMVAFIQGAGGWLAMEDLAEFHVEIEDAVYVDYRGYDVYSCNAWCQGPVVPMALNILEGFDIKSQGPGSADTYHLVLEVLKAAFADRERYFGDPRFVSVPIDGLLAKGYGAQWRERLAMDRAWPGMPDPGDPWRFSSRSPGTTAWTPPAPRNGPTYPDTSYLCVVDSEGNAFSATPSDGVVTGPVVPGLGFSVSARGSQSWLDQSHPCAVGPRRRPRLTPSPGLVMKDGLLVMPYGTPGNDVQPQAMLQVLVNFIDFGMNVQAAIEAPRGATYSYPRSSDPHPYLPGLAHIEDRAGDDVLADLRHRGHDIHFWPSWAGTAGSLGAIYVDHDAGVLHAGADPRRVAYAFGR